jgi:hypothetical protein
MYLPFGVQVVLEKRLFIYLLKVRFDKKEEEYFI